MSSGRRLWLVVGGAVAALLLGYGALTAIELLTTTTRTEQLTLPALDGVRRLRLDSAGGSVTVTRGGSGRRGILPKYCRALANTSSLRISPTTTSVALLGT